MSENGFPRWVLSGTWDPLSPSLQIFFLHSWADEMDAAAYKQSSWEGRRRRPGCFVCFSQRKTRTPGDAQRSRGSRSARDTILLGCGDGVLTTCALQQRRLCQFGIGHNSDTNGLIKHRHGMLRVTKYQLFPSNQMCHSTSPGEKPRKRWTNQTTKENRAWVANFFDGVAEDKFRIESLWEVDLAIIFYNNRFHSNTVTKRATHPIILFGHLIKWYHRFKKFHPTKHVAHLIILFGHLKKNENRYEYIFRNMERQFYPYWLLYKNHCPWVCLLDDNAGPIAGGC